MRTIKAYTSWNDYSKIHYYENFYIIDKLPKLKPEMIKNEKYKAYDTIPFKIEDVQLDCEPGNPEVYNYDFYKIYYFNNDDYFFFEQDELDCVHSEYVAVLKDDED